MWLEQFTLALYLFFQLDGSKLGQLCPPGAIWQCLETFLVVTVEDGVGATGT